MEQNKKETDVTYWHPAFYADIQIELQEDADNLTFENEHQLGKKPMEIDVLIIKKNKNRPVKKNIGRIFRKHNILEYKGPGTSLSIDSFYKVYGYTCFYKTDVPHVNSLSVKDLTITFVSEKYPRKMIRHLEEVRGYKTELTEPGIYRIHGDVIPIQIIVTRQLSEDENLWLKSLTNNLKGTEKAKKLIEDYKGHRENNLYRAVFETIMRENQKIFKEVNGMSDINSLFMEFVQDEFDQKVKEETEKAIAAERKEAEKEREKAVEAERKEAKRIRLTDHISLVQKKYAKNKPLPVIADELETEPEELLSVYEAITRNPEKTAEEICELVFG